MCALYEGNGNLQSQSKSLVRDFFFFGVFHLSLIHCSTLHGLHAQCLCWPEMDKRRKKKITKRRKNRGIELKMFDKYYVHTRSAERWKAQSITKCWMQNVKITLWLVILSFYRIFFLCTLGFEGAVSQGRTKWCMNVFFGVENKNLIQITSSIDEKQLKTVRMTIIIKWKWFNRFAWADFQLLFYFFIRFFWSHFEFVCSIFLSVKNISILTHRHRAITDDSWFHSPHQNDPQKKSPNKH